MEANIFPGPHNRIMKKCTFARVDREWDNISFIKCSSTRYVLENESSNVLKLKPSHMWYITV